MTVDLRHLEGKRVVITGVAGFIGSQLAEATLACGAEVVGVDWAPRDSPVPSANLARLVASDAFRLIEADVCDPVAMAGATAGATHLVHLAGIPGVRGHGPHYWKVNHDGTVVALEAAVRSGVERAVVASSSSVYGVSRHPLGEESVQTPRSDYASSKAAAERAAARICQGRCELVVLRYFTVFGPRQRREMLCSRLLHSALSGTPVDIYGDGSQTRPFTYVDDAIAGTLAALTSSSAAGPYNIAGARSVSVKEMVEIVESCVGRPPTLSIGKAHPVDPQGVSVDLSRASRDLGYAPRVGPQEGIRLQCEHMLSEAAQASRQAAVIQSH
jgi:UDP-glucuronate 4-epimerase